MNFYQLVPEDFNEGVLELTLEETGAYIIIINALHLRENGIPDDEYFVAKLLHTDIRIARRLLAALIQHGKLYSKEGKLHNPRTDRDLKAYRSKTDFRRTSAGSSKDLGQKTEQNQRSAEQNLESNIVKQERIEIPLVATGEDRPVISAYDMVCPDGTIYSHEEMLDLEQRFPSVKNIRGLLRAAYRQPEGWLDKAAVPTRYRKQTVLAWLAKRESAPASAPRVTRKTQDEIDKEEKRKMLAKAREQDENYQRVKAYRERLRAQQAEKANGSKPH